MPPMITSHWTLAAVVVMTRNSIEPSARNPTLPTERSEAIPGLAPAKSIALFRTTRLLRDATLGSQPDYRPLDQLAKIIRQIANSEFGTRQINKNSHRLTERLRYVTHPLNAPRMIGMIAVRRIHARNIHAALDQLLDNTGWSVAVPSVHTIWSRHFGESYCCRLYIILQISISWPLLVKQETPFPNCRLRKWRKEYLRNGTTD